MHWRIGGDTTWGSSSSNLIATFDETAVYGRVLTPAEIDAHYGLPKNISRQAAVKARASGMKDWNSRAKPSGSARNSSMPPATGLVMLCGIYCGAIGRLGFDGSADFNIAIRTIVRQDGRMAYQTGAGIVHALAFAFEAFVALGGGFFGRAAVVGDLADALAGFVGLGVVLGIGFALGPGVCRVGGESQAQCQCKGPKGCVEGAGWGHDLWSGWVVRLVPL